MLSFSVLAPSGSNQQPLRGIAHQILESDDSPIVDSTLSEEERVGDIRQPLLPLWITPTGSAT